MPPFKSPLRPLPADVKDRWVKWLYDPNNKQLKHKLFGLIAPLDVAYCCLGGLGVCLNIPLNLMSGLTVLVPSGPNAREQALLDRVPAEVQAVLTQPADNALVRMLFPYVTEQFDVQNVLAYMNDMGNASFEHIADWIEVWL